MKNYIYIFILAVSMPHVYAQTSDFIYMKNAKFMLGCVLSTVNLHRYPAAIPLWLAKKCKL